MLKKFLFSLMPESKGARIALYGCITTIIIAIIIAAALTDNFDMLINLFESSPAKGKM